MKLARTGQVFNSTYAHLLLGEHLRYSEMLVMCAMVLGAVPWVGKRRLRPCTSFSADQARSRGWCSLGALVFHREQKHVERSNELGLLLLLEKMQLEVVKRRLAPDARVC